MRSIRPLGLAYLGRHQFQNIYVNREFQYKTLGPPSKVVQHNFRSKIGLVENEHGAVMVDGIRKVISASTCYMSRKCVAARKPQCVKWK